MDSSLKKRVLTAVLGVPLIILFLLSPSPVVIAVVMAASIIGLHEYYGATGLKKNYAICTLGIIAAIVIPLAGFFKPHVVMSLVYLYIMALFILMLIQHKTLKFSDIAVLLTGLIYIPYFLSHIIYIRNLEHGTVYIWLVFIGAFMTDTFAYFVGCSIGGKKLCPGISPKKTVAGAVGGLLGCALCFIIFGAVINGFFSGALDGEKLSLVRLFILGLISAVISEIGDLIGSVIKRQYNIKDFGKLLPGHGGILDRCDSIITVAPVIFLFLTEIGIFI